jgi:hypothetical protein
VPARRTGVADSWTGMRIGTNGPKVGYTNKAQVFDLGLNSGAGDGNRTRALSLGINLYLIAESGLELRKRQADVGAARGRTVPVVTAVYPCEWHVVARGFGEARPWAGYPGVLPRSGYSWAWLVARQPARPETTRSPGACKW